jgi:hypothetical protein
MWPTQPTSHWLPGTHSPGLQRPEREADRSPLSTVDVKNERIYAYTPYKSLWRSA